MNLIITDGGNREGTYGSFLIFDNEGNRILGQQLYWGVGDHNFAEYLILLLALEAALTNGLKRVIIFSDSETVVKQVAGERPLHSKKLKRLKNQIMERLECFEIWEICHVPRVYIKTFLGH